MAGDLRAAGGYDAGRTLDPGDVPFVKPGGPVCWLLDRGKHIPLRVGMNTIGRLPDNDIVLDDPTVSRRHCAVMVHSDLSCELHDVASKNGTTINGRKIQGPTRLRDGDEICLSEKKLSFVSQSGKEPEPFPSAAHSDMDDKTMVER